MTRLQFVRKRLIAQPPPLLALACAVGAVAAPTLIREAFDPVLHDEVTFATYYPFVMVAALFLGWRYALGVALGTTLVANYLFMAPRYRLMAQPSDTVGAGLFLICAALMIVTAETLRRTAREVDDGVSREATLNRELQHRVRNMITVVQGLANQTFRAASADEALPLFMGRLRAMSEANAVLSGGHWETCRMPDLAERALTPFRDHGGVTLTGPVCTLPEASCVPLVLALHELGVNAVKYGALSLGTGRIDVTWSLQAVPGGHEIALAWRETGGPPVRPPTRRGLGSRLLTAQRGLEAVDLNFAPEGLVCAIRAAGAQPISGREKPASTDLVRAAAA
jgi:two-component sensor histidine kinase